MEGTVTQDAGAQPPWLADATLGPVAEINALLVEGLRARVRVRPPAAALPPLLTRLAPMWNSLDDSAIARLARCPYVLVDASFVEPLLLGTRETVRDGGAESYLPAADARGVARLYGTFAWHLVRTHRVAARMVLGIGELQAQAVASLALRDLERFTEPHAGLLRPLWADRPDFWSGFIVAAINGDDGALRRARVRGLQWIASRGWGA